MLQIADYNSYFTRVETLLRRSLGVSTSAKGAMGFRPAPPQAVGPLGEDGIDGDEDAGFVNQADFGGEFMDWQDMKKQIKHEEL